MQTPAAIPAPPPLPDSGAGAAPPRRRQMRQLAALAGATALAGLLFGLWAALQRLGFQLPAHPDLTLAHGPLMACGFLGALVALERATACGARWAMAAPLLLGLGALALAPDWERMAAVLMIGGSLALLAVYGVILRRRAEDFTLVMTGGAVALLLGNLYWAAGVLIPLMVYWWAGFLLLTIFAERMELSRLQPVLWRAASAGGRRLYAGLRRYLAWAGVGLYSLALGVAARHPVHGMRLAGGGMLALALWLAVYDPVWRMLSRRGLPRYIGANLLCGQAWLALSGALWARYAGAMYFHYDAMLHSLFLGFVMTMVFAHAPIIFPAVSGRPLAWGRWFYAPAGLLQASLLGRIGTDLMQPPAPAWWQFWGALNVAALLLFILTVAAGAGRGRRHQLRPAG